MNRSALFCSTLARSALAGPALARAALPRLAVLLPRLTAGLLGSIALGAQAHPGHAGMHSLVEGFVHPFSGLDHLAAMLVVGMWSALTLRRVWLAPLAFMGLLCVGAVLGYAGIDLPAVEPMIACSLLTLGLLLARAQALPPGASALLVGVFALFHGAAHGGEFTGDQAWAAGLGMLAATALLHIAGIAFGQRLLAPRAWLRRSTGLGVMALGGALLLGLV